MNRSCSDRIKELEKQSPPLSHEVLKLSEEKRGIADHLLGILKLAKLFYEEVSDRKDVALPALDFLNWCYSVVACLLPDHEKPRELPKEGAKVFRDWLGQRCIYFPPWTHTGEMDGVALIRAYELKRWGRTHISEHQSLTDTSRQKIENFLKTFG